jgi:hypothetical protein
LVGITPEMPLGAYGLSCRCGLSRLFMIDGSRYTNLKQQLMWSRSGLWNTPENDGSRRERTPHRVGGRPEVHKGLQGAEVLLEVKGT